MTGNECFTKFVQERLVTNHKIHLRNKKKLSIYRKITKNKIKTDIAKVPKKSNPVEVIKEDVEGFRILSEKNVPLSKAFKHPHIKQKFSHFEEGMGNVLIKKIFFLSH